MYNVDIHSQARVHVLLHVCVFYTHACMHCTQILLCMYACAYAHAYEWITHARMNVTYTYARTCTCAREYDHKYAYTHMYDHTCACRCVDPACGTTYIPENRSKYTHIHTHIHAYIHAYIQILNQKLTGSCQYT